MKLKNDALQKLYNTLVNAPITVTVYDIDNAFQKCDDALERANKEIEKLRREVSTKDKRNNELQKQLLNIIPDHTDESAKKEIDYLRKSRLEWAKRSVDRRKERDDAREECENLKNRLDEITNHLNDVIKTKLDQERELGELKESLSYGALKKMQDRLDEVTKDRDDAKKQLNYFTNSRDTWRARAKYAEDEIEALKKDNKDLEKRLMETTETLEKTNADRNSYNGLCTELKKDYDRLFEENRKLKARTDCLRMEVEWYRKHYKEKSDKIQELKSTLNSMCGDEYIKKLQDSVSKNCYDQGQTDLWDMLQNVKDSQPNEFDVECECLGDVIDMDLENFLDAYKKWQEEKEKERLDYMRDYLARFCEGRVCKGCPLGSDEFKCGKGYSFKKSADWDMRIIPDEELERYYEKARGCGAYNLKDGKLFIHDLSHPMESINRGVTKACEQFCKAVRYADTKLKENNPLDAWECTLEGTINVEINKDLAEKVFGVKLDDK